MTFTGSQTPFDTQPINAGLAAPVVAPTVGSNSGSTGVSASPTDTRSLISQTSGPGLIQGYDTQNNYNPVYVPKGQYVAGISATPKQITPDSLRNTAPINTSVNVPQTAPNADVANAGAQQTVTQIAQQLAPQETPLDQQQQGLLNSMAQLSQDLGNKGADQLAAEQSQGVPQLKQQFSDLNSQILTKLAESKALDASYQNANLAATGTSGTLLRTQGTEAANYRQYTIQKNNMASDIGLLQATAQGLQGQITTAQDTANRAIDLKYSTEEAQLNTLKAQLDAIQPSLNKQEKIQALAQQTYLQQQQQKIADQKQTQKSIQDLKFQAMQAGLTDSKVLSQFDKVQTVAEAQNLAAPYVAKAGNLENQLKGLSIQQAQLNIGKTKAEIAKLNSQINDQGDTTNSLAQSLVNGTLAPSELSKRATGTNSYNGVLKAADDYSMQTTGKHFDIAKADRDYKFANQPQTQNTLNYLTSLVGGPGQTGNLDTLVNSAALIPAKVSTGWFGSSKYPALNKVDQWAALMAGDPAIAAYHATLTETADQVAKILQGGGTGGTSDAKLLQAQALFDKGFNPSQISAVATALKPLLANRGISMTRDNPYLKDYADQLGYNKEKSTQTTAPAIIPPEQIPAGMYQASDGLLYKK